MEKMDIDEVNNYTPDSEATEIQKLQCALINFFNSEEVTNSAVKTDFQPNAHLLGPERTLWGVTDASTIAELGFRNTRNDSLKFSAFTSSAPSSGVRKLRVNVDVSARNVGGIVSAGGEELYSYVIVSWESKPEAALPDWRETLRFVRLGLMRSYGREDGTYMFDHPELGRVRVTKKKGTKS